MSVLRSGFQRCGTALALLGGAEAVVGEDLLRLIGVLQPFVELLCGFGGGAGLAQRCGVFVAFHVGQFDGTEVGALLLGGGEVGGVDEARVRVTGGDLGRYVGDLAFGGCVLVTNKLVLVTAEGNPGKINSLDDLKTTEGVVAVCKEDVPCGTIAHQELKKHDITLKNATTESKVTDVATKVTTGNADAGFIYTTDLAAAKKKGVNLGSVELTDVERNEYPAALSKTGSSSETAKKFNEWLKNSDEAKKILTEYGFNTAQ